MPSFVSKSVSSLLLKFNWTRIAFFHSARNDSEYPDVATSIRETFKKTGIKIRLEDSPRQHCPVVTAPAYLMELFFC